MSFQNGIWKLWREAQEFFQRFEGKVSNDKKVIAASWNLSKDGKTWDHDFNVTYNKID